METKETINSLIDEMIRFEINSLNTINKNSKIFLAGHKGIVGSAILKFLKKKNIMNYSR